jgi:hypothetical protein
MAQPRIYRLLMAVSSKIEEAKLRCSRDPEDILGIFWEYRDIRLRYHDVIPEDST